LGGRAILMLGLGLADSLFSFSILIVLSGFFGYLFNPALNSMVADLVEPEQRTEAYALMRIVSNLGIAIGPAIGGFIATRSYFVSFVVAALASAIYFFIILFFTRETKPELSTVHGDPVTDTMGYGPIVRDVSFLAFCLSYVVMGIAYAQMMTILPVYMKDGFHIVESQFGLIMATNAAMVVLFQFPVTRMLRRLALGPTLTLGALFVAVGLGTVAFSSSFPMFLMSMVIVTIGELIFFPACITFVADIAPESMRGRYMGVFGMSLGASFGMAPVLGGFINDNIGPVFIWHIMASVAFLSAVSFLLIGGRAVRDSIRPELVTKGLETAPANNPGLSCVEKRCSQTEQSVK
jgi:MFS family permease